MLLNDKQSAFILGMSVFLGLSALGALLAYAAIDCKQLERTVTVRGLSEREYGADIVIWPIQFTVANNDLDKLYLSIEQTSDQIRYFLEEKGIDSGDISITSLAITDKLAHNHNDGSVNQLRYTARQTLIVYSYNIRAVREIMSLLPELGKKRIVFSGGGNGLATEYLFNKLDEIKPKMIEEATKKAWQVARKVATNSKSSLGKIKSATQGQFIISDRDKNNPHIKRISVVLTVTYYLAD